MNSQSYRWISESRKHLRETYAGKTILVHGTEIAKVFDGPMNPIELNRIGRELFGTNDWAFTYLDRETNWLLLSRLSRTSHQ